MEKKRVIVIVIISLILIGLIGYKPLSTSRRYNRSIAIINAVEKYIETEPRRARKELPKIIETFKTIDDSYKGKKVWLEKARGLLNLVDINIAKEEKEYIKNIEVKKAWAAWVPRGHEFGPLSNDQWLRLEIKNAGKKSLSEITVHYTFLSTINEVLSSGNYTWKFEKKPFSPGSTRKIEKTISRSRLFREVYSRMKYEIVGVKFK